MAIRLKVKSIPKADTSIADSAKKYESQQKVMIERLLGEFPPLAGLSNDDFSWQFLQVRVITVVDTAREGL